MNWFDLLLILVIIAGVGTGFQRGFIRASAELLTLALALLIAALLYDPVANFLEAQLGVAAPIRSILAFLFVGLGSLAILSTLSSLALLPLASSVRSIFPVRVIDNLAGLIPGIIYGLLFGVLITLVVGLVPAGDSVNRAVASSDIASRLRVSAQDATIRMADQTGMDLTDFVYIVVPNGEESYELPSPVIGELRVDESDEIEMLRLLNEERIASGLPELTWDSSLRQVARGHSDEMMRLGYFSHTSPQTGSLADRLATVSYGYQVAGENLAYAPTVGIAHRGLMQSDGHRANILSPEYERVGIGTIVADDGSRMYTQVFARQ